MTLGRIETKAGTPSFGTLDAIDDDRVAHGNLTYDVTGLKGGGTAYVWERQSGAESGSLFLTVENAVGEAVVETLKIDGATDRNRGHIPQVTWLADGGFVVAYGSRDRDRDTITLVWFDAEGTQQASFTPTSGSKPFPGKFAIVPTQDGVALAHWDTPTGYLGEARLILRYYEVNDGAITPAGPAQLVTTLAPSISDTTQLEADYTPDGIALAWSVRVREEGRFDQDIETVVVPFDGVIQSGGPGDPQEGRTFLRRGTDGDDTLSGDRGENDMRGFAGDDLLLGRFGDDSLYGDLGDDTLSGSDGDDDLFGGSGADKLDGGQGDDLLDGGAGQDTLHGGEGDDRLDGGAGNDVMVGGAGDDVYYVDLAQDRVVEARDEGFDEIFAMSSVHLRSSFVERVTLDGTANTRVTDGVSATEIIGNSGNNVLIGGGGADTLTGGLGDDYFVLLANTGAETSAVEITDFRPGDKLLIDDRFLSFGDASINLRPITPEGAAAALESNRFFYEEATSTLFLPGSTSVHFDQVGYSISSVDVLLF
ncbi:hypothetical protein JANAI62_30130 [Jannaschia pagri]|uniref:Hemolysin-type calcium-binding repeat-containing protein n=1 Tax=Jannaschia pagri TaxID=2829797 RepID=A0ABQ4NQ30_9RHOB|nr:MULTISPECIES: calcium-binding protein [unclassified Jannaschia]GIT92750.1 hypothetical protein JANAI61_32080 [Jannaschia sp. AI_61]GIT96390.1 hypothetical protein JANAI62_30130 [Jannaschia sp. AI_62]